MGSISLRGPNRAKLGWLLGGLCSAVLGCGEAGQEGERAGSVHAPILALDPPAAVEAGSPAPPRSATCPGDELPDQCGSWAGVELHASREVSTGHGHHHHQCRHHDHHHHDSSAVNDDERCVCQPLDFVIPSELQVTSGKSGNSSDKAELSFRTAQGGVVECEYRGNLKPGSGRHHPETGGDKYVFQRCTRGFKAGQSASSDWFQLDLGDGHGSSGDVEVDVRLGEPDVVGGVVQEQVFYADDPQIAGATLHVPRGAAPAFETFSLDAVSQVSPGTEIPNGGDASTSVSFGVDVHSDTSESFVFTPVAGASCPRVELPYDPATLEQLLGAGSESALQASHLISLEALASGEAALEQMGAVTVNLAAHTLSFCVQHLSIYLGVLGSNNARLERADLFVDGTPLGNLVDDSLLALPVLYIGNPYQLELTFRNTGSASSQWGTPTNQVKLVPVELKANPSPPVGAQTINGLTITELPSTSPNSWQPREGSTTLNLPTSPVAFGDAVTFNFYIKAPPTPSTLNFCLRSGAATDRGYFGECFSWDLHRYTGGGGQLPVATQEMCDDIDNDFDGVTDEDLYEGCYDPNQTGEDDYFAHYYLPCHRGQRTCSHGHWGLCEGQQFPVPETCNGLDDDCDLLVDNNCH